MNLQAGNSGKRLDHSVLASIASQVVERVEADDVLSYGGWSTEFIKSFRPQRRLTIQSYRPAIEGSRSIAVPSDVVVSIDHLNNAGMLKVQDALDDLKRVTLKAGFFYLNVLEFPDDVVTGNTVPRPVNWWLNEFLKRFDVHTFQRLPGGFYVIVYPMTEQVIH